MKRYFIKILVLISVMFPAVLYASSGAGNIDESTAIERVAVSQDGRLYAWDKEGRAVSGWPKDLTAQNRIFSYGPRLIDVDYDLKMEVVAVSEDKDGGNLKLHVFKGNGSELDSWRFDIPYSDLVETPIIADVNKDSSPEIIMATRDNRVFVYRRDFRNISNFTRTFDSTAHPVVADPDNDGMGGLFAASGNTIYTWDQYGNATVFYRLPGGEEIIGNIAVEDVTRDDYPDLVFSTTGGRIVGLDQFSNVVLEIFAPAGINITSEVIAYDIDVDKFPELMVITDREELLAYEVTGEVVSAVGYELDYRESSLTGGIVANDLYQGLFSSITGWDQNTLYRTKYNRYSRIKIGDNVREWDTFAGFDFLELIDIFDVFSFPKPFTPNADGVNDSTTIHYRLSDEALVALDLYDSHGHFISRIKDKELRSAGEHSETWSGVDTRGTATVKDDLPLDTGLYIVKIFAESKEGFVSVAKVSTIVNGIKAEIEVPADSNEDDAIFPAVFGKVTVSGIATDPNFGEGNLDADFQAYKLYYRPGIWSMTDDEVVAVGQVGSSWLPAKVPLRHQCSGNDYNEAADLAYPDSNVSCRPVQHGVLGTFDAGSMESTPNGEYTLLLKVTDSNGNTAGKVNYDTLVVTVGNPNPSDPFDHDDPFDINNPDNPKYLGPKITNTSLTNAHISRDNSSTTIRYKLENETSNVHITIFPYSDAGYSAAAAIYSFNYVAPNDPGNPLYSFTWDGTNTLGRNVGGGSYKIRITANAIDGTGEDIDESLSFTVARGFAASDILDIAKDPDTGSERFSATPGHFSPLGFGPSLNPVRTSLNYELTKEARITLQVLEGVEGEGLVLRKTISSGKIRRVDDGTEYWDGSGDNGLILPVDRDYIIRLIAEGIDIGNEELIHKDIVVHLDSLALNGSLAADIRQLKGDDGEVVNENDNLTAMVGNPDFLWRAKGDGYIEMPFNYTISASGSEIHTDEDNNTGIGKAFICSEYSVGGGGGGGAGGSPSSQGWPSVDIDVSLQNGFTVDSFGIGVDGAAVAVRNESFTSSEEFTIPPSREYSQPFGGKMLQNSSSVHFVIASAVPRGGAILENCRTVYPVEGYGYDDWWSVCRYCHNSGTGNNFCVDGPSSPGFFDIYMCGNVSVWVNGSKEVTESWGPYQSSGSGTIVSTSTNPRNDFDSYRGQVGSGLGIDPWITGYTLTASNQINGVNRQSSGDAIDLPGLRVWRTDGNISAEVMHNGGLLTSYHTDQHDPYLQSTTIAPYKKIWAAYNNFNSEYFKRTTDNINIYNGGYRPNIFSGSPGTNLYSFSDRVRLTGWDIDVRYPNITVSKPDGDNALNTGSGHQDVFAIDTTHVTPAGIRGVQNSNIEDYFRLRLLPDAVPKRFVEIRGNAGTNYELFYYDNDEVSPQWRSIEPRTHNTVSNNILAHWDVTKLNGENYTVILRTKSGSNVNIDTFNIGIGTIVDTSGGSAGDICGRAYTPFKRASLIFGCGSLPEGPELITISPVDRSEADFTLPAGIAPLGPIFDIKPDDIEIDPNYHVQLEITYSRDELETFGVGASEITIYNLAGDNVLEGLATVATYDDMDDADPSNDVWRFTAVLEHFSQYFLGRKSAAYFHIDSPASDQFLNGIIDISGRAEALPRTDSETPQALAGLTDISISYYSEDDPDSITQIYHESRGSATTSISEFNFEWNVSNLNGAYVLRFDSAGPQGSNARHEIHVAIDNNPTQSVLLINGRAVADGANIAVATGAVIEIKTTDTQSEEWQSGVQKIEYSFDGGDYEEYQQPFNLYYITGEHEFVYRAIDNNGNIEPDKSAIIVVEEMMQGDEADETTINLSVYGPAYNSNNLTWVGEDTTFGLTATGEYENIRYRVDSSEYLIYREPFSIQTVEEGPYIIEYFGSDQLGLRSNVGAKPIIFDISPPESSVTIEGLYQQTDSALVVTPVTRIAFTALDSGETPSGLNRVEYKRGDGPWEVYSTPLTFSEDSVLSYRSIDNIGNIEDEKTINVKIDDTGPALGAGSIPNVISPNGDGRFDEARIVINASDNIYEKTYLTMTISDEDGNGYTVFDSVELSAGINTLTWDGKISGELIGEAAYSYQITVEDEGGNVSSAIEGSIIYDITPPTISVVDGMVRSFSPNGDDIAEVLQVDYTVSDNLFSDNILTELKILSQGEHEILRSVDTVSIPPEEHRLNWNGTNAAENDVFDGIYDFMLVAEDPAGNRSNSEESAAGMSGEIFVDRFSPSTEFSIQGPVYEDTGKTWLGEGALIKLDATDPLPASGIDKVFYNLNDGEPVEYLLPFPLPMEAVDYAIYYNSVDQVGNIEDRQSKNARLDITDPETTIEIGEPKEMDGEDLFISPLTGISLSTADGDGVGVEQIYMEIEGVREPSLYDENITLNGLGDGYYNILYWAEDYLGNTEAKHSLEVMLDKTPPETALIIGEPKVDDNANNLTYITSATELSFNAAADRHDLDRTEYKVNDGEWLPAATFTLETEGEHLISFRSFDRLGNEEPMKTERILVDNSPPVASLGMNQQAGGDVNYVTPDTVISLSGSDSGSDTDIIEYSIDGGEFTAYNGSFTLGDLGPGAHVITYRIRDRLGNVSEETAYAVQLISLSVERSSFRIPRVLAFMLQTRDLRPEDPKPNEDLMQGLKDELGGYMTIIKGDQSDPAVIERFITEMRSDKYTTFIIATDAYVVEFYDTPKVVNMLKELKSRIYKGDLLITDVGYSSIHGNSWHDFISGFSPSGENYADLFVGLENSVALNISNYGRGRMAAFGSDIGRLAGTSVENYPVMILGLSELIRKIMPDSDQNNAGEVVDYRLTYQNHGDDPVTVKTKELFPEGWLQTNATTGEVPVETRNFEITIPSQSSRYVDYLYRPSAGTGYHELAADVEAEWTNSLMSRGSVVTPFVVENDIVELIGGLIGYNGLIYEGDLPEVVKQITMLKRRLLLAGAEINTDQDIDELIGLALAAVDELAHRDHDEKDAINYTLSEIIEGLGVLQSVRNLNLDMSISSGDPNNPASYHGGTTDHIGAGKGGCSLIISHRLRRYD